MTTMCFQHLQRVLLVSAVVVPAPAQLHHQSIRLLDTVADTILAAVLLRHTADQAADCLLHPISAEFLQPV